MNDAYVVTELFDRQITIKTQKFHVIEYIPYHDIVENQYNDYFIWYIQAHVPTDYQTLLVSPYQIIRDSQTEQRYYRTVCQF